MSVESAPAPQFPAPEKCTPADLELCACWVNEHGDPADWSPETWQAYAATIVCARAAGAL